MKLSWKQITAVIVILGLSLLASLWAGQLTGDLVKPAYRVAAAPPFELVHTFEGITARYIAVDEARVFFIGSQNSQKPPALTALDTTSGEVAWQITADSLTRPLDWPADWEWHWPFEWQWGGLVAGQGQLFVADALVLETAVTAYDTATGQQQWHTPLGLLNGGDVDSLSWQDGLLAARINDAPYFNGFYELQTDGWLSQEVAEDAAYLFHVDAETGRTYETQPHSVLVSHHEGWQVTFQSCNPQATIVEQSIFVQVQPCETPVYQWFALDRQTGAGLWTLPDTFLCAATLADGVVYGITTELQLTAVSLTTGQLLGTTPFTATTQPTGCLLAANTNTLAAYFPDSQQLFVFRHQTKDLFSQLFRD